jgi:molybdopterin-synthase adenylyltransferase
MISDRYSRQVLFDQIGKSGQLRLQQSRVAIAGCGALGTAQAEALARAGVGELRIIDRDFIEPSNLQRQTMFTEADAADRLPKSVAAKNHLAQINSEVRVEPHIADLSCANVERLIRGCDLVLDGTDNFATRYLINDACVKHGIPWIYGAAVASYGLTMTIRPGATPCLRCVFEVAPPAAGAPTCDTSGVIMPIISIVAAVQTTEAIKLLTGATEELHGSLMQFDVWRNEWRRINPGPSSPNCSTCGLRRFTALEPAAAEFVAVLCGRNAVQISPAQTTTVDFARLADRLRPVGEVKFNDYLLRFRAGDFELTVFADARSIIRGTDQISTARSLYAKYIGN